MKHKWKKVCAGALALTLFSTAILPYIGQKKVEAFSSSYGVCIDNHNFSSAGSWSKNDRYSNKMINMNDIEAQYGYKSPEYNQALQANIDTLHRTISTDDDVLLKMFWSGIVTFVSEGKSFDNVKDLLGAQQWFNYAIQNYQDSVFHGYAPALADYGFHPMTESELGTVVHGAAGQAIIDRDPLLKMLTNAHTLFPVGQYDPNRNYETDPLALPRLGNAWLNSYEAQQAENGGKALWPKDSAGHEVSGPIGFVPSYEQVSQVALDMDSNSDYYTIHSVTVGSGNTEGPSTYSNNEDWEDEDIEGEDDGEEEDDGPGTSATKKNGYYVINCTEDFFNNCGWLKVWNGESWVSIGSLTHFNQHTNINGWDIFPTATEGSWCFIFEWKGEGKPQGLVMYFELPQNSVVSTNQKGFDSPIEFVARHTNVFTCDSCGGTHPGSKNIANHQRHISFYFPEDGSTCYPCFRLGDPTGIPIEPETGMHFCIFRHTEDWESNYNVQLTKHDYETGKKLENSIFELYERFDDKDQINRGHDGAVELYEGIDNDSDQEWQSKYTTSPVIWDDFRLVNSYTTDGEGHIEDDVKKGYHYEKTFCDGHPAPEFCEVPEEEEDNEEEIEAAQKANKEVAALWQEYFDECSKMAEEDRPGVHFHWLSEEVDQSVIDEISESGGEPGETPDAGTAGCPGLDKSYKESGCQQDCEDTYNKFIELEYSYTWIETKARNGYIRHDRHTDDVPIEVITTDSSEAGANSYFADEYSKDIIINENVNSSGGNEEDGDFEENEEDDETVSLSSVLSSMNLFGITAYAAETDPENEWNVWKGKPIEVEAVFENVKEEISTEHENDFEEENEDDTSFYDYEIEFGTATDSNADEEKIKAPAYDEEDFNISVLMSLRTSSKWNSDVMAISDDDEGESGSSEDYMTIYKQAFTDAFTGGDEVEIGPSDNWSHCNDTDGEGNEWRVYDHRTSGEIHFNKRDMDLVNKENTDYNAYADANADGKMEGAVYGLFAKNDIEHPDGKTGIVFKKNDLVAIGTTDRNGDGSFLTITEAPGTIYNYEKGTTETTSWNSNAPKNLYREGAKTSTIQPHVVFNDGETTEWFCDDYTEDGTYKGGLTQRLYDNNESNNMNCWIGRPLFMGEYYIKELSRSEGYELSVSGRLDAITNRGGDLSVSEETNSGSVTVSRNLYIQGQDSIGEANEPFFEVTSEGTNENGGYDIVLTKLPEGTKIYRHDSITEKGTYQAIDRYEYVGKVDENGNPVYKIAKTTGIPILKGDGTNDILMREEPGKYYVSGINVANIKEFDEIKIEESLKGKQKVNEDGTISYPDFDTMQTEFTMGPDSTYYIRFVKWKLEAALRTAGITTPNVRYTVNGSTSKAYSEQEMPYYSRGIRKGEIDVYGVSGVPEGEVATKTVYGPQIINIEVSKTNDLGNPISNGDMLYNLLQYYMDHPYWNFGGIDRIEDDGDHYNVYIYAHNSLISTSFGVLGTNKEDTVIYRRLEFDPNDTSFEPYIVYVPYENQESDESFGIYSNLNISNKYGTTKISATLSPDVIIDRDGNLSERIVQVPETYEIGDVIHDKNGNPEQELEAKPVYVEKEIDEIRMEWTEVPARYENGKYIIHVDMPGSDIFGKEITDANGKKTLEFKAVVPEKDIILTQEDINNLPSYYGMNAGDVFPSGAYEVEVKKARAYAYLDYTNEQESNEDTYIKEAILSYPGDEYVFQDGDGNPGSGTIRNPIRVMERPIRQKVKITKDIQTIPDSEEYLNDTYSEVHKENLSKNNRGSWYERTKDWLASLLGNDIEGQTASKIPEFRFKAYLKSNLERLYRDNDGNITWQDRNGNAYVPSYQDTNYDGNYDTFVWQSGTSTFDFPEKSIENGTSLESANVQKIYTKVEHKASSTTAGDISNNVWAKYADPQTGNTTNVGEVEGFSTSQDGENGEAVNVNAALYSYDDKNTNVKQTDKINQNQNQGYTRLLETRLRTMEDGAGKTREVEEYNYEKFFDAMAAANNDKWDNDMYSSTKNYPGQHWFDTFEERYQMDDADPDRTLANVDGVDEDGTAGGDRDNSFKPFQWIREHMFGTTQDAKDDYPATHDNDNLENKINTSDIAHRNAEASNEVRQFAIKWYLDDEVGKLVTNNGYDEDVAKKGYESYQEEVYDQALEQALIKAYNYLKPFYKYDLDTIYSVEWDSAENGGSDGDVTTLSADILYEMNGTSQGESKSGYYYGVSAYLPYGTYVLVEQQPFREDLDDFDNKHYKTDMPKELILPAVYEDGGNVGSPEVFHAFYNYNTKDTPVDLAKKYMIRFNEEWAENHTDDLRNYVIRAHGYDGDYEVYKYGLDVDKLIDTITYGSGNYSYDGYSITQDIYDPLKDYYNDPLVDTAYDGGNADSHYFADEDNKTFKTASGIPYPEDAIEKRYHFGSISENAGMANDVLYQLGSSTDDNNPSGFYFKDNVKTMTGNQTAYEGKYASMLVPWSVTEPAKSAVYSADDMTGYADRKFRNTFYQTKLRIEKVDSETGEQLLHDDAIFSIYAASRYTSRAEIEKAGAPAGTEIGDVKFYMEDTMITGSKEFLMSMGAWNIEPVMRGRAAVGMDELYTGIVAAGTPVCLEEEQIIMEDMLGNKTGQFKVYTTLNDVETVVEENAKGPEDKAYADQNTGYLVTPQPLGAGVYVIAETKAPNGYAKTRPIAVEIYSDSVSYYMNGLMDSKVESTIYQGNLIEQ